MEHARQSVQADPDHEFGHVWYGYMLAHWGRPLEARWQIEIARGIAPSKATVYRALGHTYYAQRDFTNAIAMYRQAIAWQSHHTVAHRFIGRCYAAPGDYLQAISWYEEAAILGGASENEVKAKWESHRRAFREGGARGYWQEEWKRLQQIADGQSY